MHESASGFKGKRHCRFMQPKGPNRLRDWNAIGKDGINTLVIVSNRTETTGVSVSFYTFVQR